MIRYCFITTLLTLALVGVFTPAPLRAQVEKSPAGATVQLKETVTLTETHVRLGDIARISDPNETRREELTRLDLATLDPDQPLTIERSLIEIRILLAGFDPQSVTIKGAERVLVSAPAKVNLTDLGVEQTVFDALCRQFSIAPEDLQVNLVTPFISSLNGLENLKQPRLELMPTPQLPLGRVQLTVRILDGTNVVAARQTTFEIARRQQVVVATSSLDRSSVVGAEHVREEIRFVDAHVDRLTAEHVVGRKVLMPMRPGEVVTLRHVSAPVVEESPILVQPRDAVRLVAKKRGLTVTIPVAEALQAGRQGQLIRVRNLQSNQIVTGTVVGRGEVHVILP